MDRGSATTMSASIRDLIQRIKNLIAKINREQGIILSLFSIIFFCFWFSLPNPLFKSPTSYVIEDEKGVLLGASIARDGQWRFPSDGIVPEKFAKCIVAFEDKRFYSHPGVDILALFRAFKQNIYSRSVVSGGSTISMQVIRLSRKKPRTLYQKLIEVVLALRLELSYSKEEIIALYAANAPFGTNVVGLDAAAWRYFGRSADQLSLGEMATLAVLPNAPSLVHPGKNRQRLTSKRNELIDKLFIDDQIDQTTAYLAKLEPIVDQPVPLPQLAPHLLTRFRSDFKNLHLSSTRTKTTLKYQLQNQVQAILQRHQPHFGSNGINNAAALVLDVETGNALAYVGNLQDPSGNPASESWVDMIPSRRSPGSVLKPLLYASMLSDGLLLPNSLVPDVPTQIAGFTPRNFDQGYDGAVPASKALYRSLNIPAVRMLQQYRYERFYQQLKKFGITSLKNPADFYGLSMILGGCEVSMWEMSGAYASMARTLKHYNRNKGQYSAADFHAPFYIKSANEKSKPALQTVSVVDYGSLWYTFQAMQEVMRPGEELLWQQFSSSRKVAWKTGTSFGFRDGWAIGLTPQYVVCIWVGNADNEGRPGLTGIEAAAPILFQIFGLLPVGKWFDVPYTSLSRMPICVRSGFKAGANCIEQDTLQVPVNGYKTAVCPYHQLIHLNRAQTCQVNSECSSVDEMVHQSWFVLPPSMEYYYQKCHSDYKPLPPFDPACNTDLKQAMELIYPKNAAKIYVPLEIDGQRGKVIFEAAHHDPKAKIFWYLDRDFIGTTTSIHQFALAPSPGPHIITLVDDRGNRLVQTFEILDKNKERLF